ncbi:tyrosine-type recombinase/integrase [Porticoccaceae bacterium]|nr:tyrosine-type recombinase/integrase [Porticoccaceae bacterium]
MSDKITQKGFEKILREGVEKPHNLGGKLYLVIRGNSRTFSFRYTKNKRTRKYSLGGYRRESNTLSDARARSLELNAMLAQGRDPHEEKEIEVSVKRTAKAKREETEKRLESTFEKIAYETIDAREPTWADPKARQTWENTLKTYAFPIIGHLPVCEIETEHIVKILHPIWHTKYPTAKKLRQRMEAVFSRAIYYKLRPANNPAAFKDNLEIPLGKSSHRVKSQPALNYRQLPDFMRELRKKDGMGARGLEFLILNANRTTEVRKARWNEFDFDKRLWVIPVEAGRLGKTKKSHIVPLSSRSIDLLLMLREDIVSEYVFPNTRSNNHLSDGGMLSLVNRMHEDRGWVDDFGEKITVHGFRSTMRDYLAEQTDIDRDVAEMILAHTVGNAVEKAYRRGDLLDKRRVAMQIWSDYATGTPIQKVIQLRGS